MVDRYYTLILDISYYPITLLDAKKAFILGEVKGKGEILEYYPTELGTLRTPNTEFPIPAVMRIAANHKKNFGNNPSRLAIFYRDMFVCVYCGKVCSDREVTIDHVIPKSRGGRWSWENLVTCCNDCNQLKGNRTPEEAGLLLLYRPYRPERFEIAFKALKKKLLPWFKEECIPMYVSPKLLDKLIKSDSRR